MGRVKKKSRQEELWEHYRAIQLTPEQKAAGRAELRRRAEEAAATGVYEELLALVGKVHLDLDLDELREDRD
ncbi:MAG TPA: hypothetical protein VN181_00900 [Thermoanaerobaculia bacterium]|nr:hypothetical protein [Thermoanaerobaculia bacterium]